jgi:archaellum biogenesis ATPase FlaH
MTYGWEKYCNELPTDSELKAWAKIPDANVGLALGKASGIVALDFDDDVDDTHDRLRDILGESTIRKVGKRGYTDFFKYSGESGRKYRKGDEMVMEVLSTGNHTVLPPSIHPDMFGKTYEYTGGDLISHINSLKEIPKAKWINVDKVFGIKKKETSVSGNVDEADVITALEYIKPDNYQTWVNVGMALKSVMGENGFDYWDKWSQSSDKYKAEEMLAKFRSFKKEGVSAATIFYLAKEGGFTPKKTSAHLFIRPEDVRTTLDTWAKYGRPLGHKVGIPSLDRRLHLRKGELTLVTGYANAGKSEFVDSIVVEMLRNHNWNTMFCSMEKLPESHIDTLVHKYLRKPREQQETQERNDAFRVLQDKIVLTNHLKHSHNIERILELVEELIEEQPLDCLVLDPFNYITSKSGDEQYQHVRNVMIDLTNFAKEHKIHIILVAHPKVPQTNNGRLPNLTMYSIAGGSNFPNIADVVMSVSRLDTGEVDVNILKVREQEVDSIGHCYMSYNKTTRGYETVVKEEF